MEELRRILNEAGARVPEKRAITAEAEREAGEQPERHAGT